MLKYKLIASDLDGTLLNSKAELSAENAAAIAKLTELGVIFVPTSGRTLFDMPASVRENPNVRYISYSDGSVVIDRTTGEKISSRRIDHELSMFLIEGAFACENIIMVRTDGRSYVNAKLIGEENYEYFDVAGHNRGFIKKYCNHLPHGFKKYCYSIDELEMISVFFKSDDDMMRYKKAAEDTGKLKAAIVSPHNLEVYHKEAGKGNSVLRLAKILGISPDEVIAVGDSSNDISMVSAVGLGLATANAADELKRVAKATICSNDSHIVKYILENFFD